MAKIVSIGGGTGQSKLLEGLRISGDHDLTAIVAVTDSGRSTGVLRQEFDILAPGDIRNCLVALSDSPQLLKDLFQFRFVSPKNSSSFHGMNFGNLFIAALTKLKGDNFAEAIKEVSNILKIKGKVLPVTLSNTQVCARLEDGTILEGDANISRSYDTRKKIQKIFLKDKNSKANPDCIEELKNADLIIIGPGGLYTSVIVNLLPKGIIEAIKTSKGKKVYISNVATQKGVTDDFDIYMHVKEIEDYLGKGILDYVIVNNKTPSKYLINKYKKAGAEYLDITSKEVNKIKQISREVILADVIQDSYVKEFGKADYIRHDPKKLADTVESLVRKKVKGVILVAGKGERMKPFSIHQSKEMLEFLGRPLVAHHVDEMIKNGIDDIIFICNDENISKIRDYFNNVYLKSLSESTLYGSGRSIKFRFVLQSLQKGPVNAVLYGREFLENDYFIVKYGDSLSKDDQIKSILGKFYEDPTVDAVITLRKVKKPEEYGIARFENDKLVEIVEKPKTNFPSDLANVGLVLLNGKVFFDAVDTIGVETVLPPGEYILRNGGKANYWIFSGERIDVGRAWNILDSHKLLIERLFLESSDMTSCDFLRCGSGISDINKIVPVKKYLALNSIVLSRNIGKNVKIGRGVFVSKDAKVGDNSIIGDFSSISGIVGKNCHIDFSLIMKNSIIGDNSKIFHSVIGEDTTIGKNFETLINHSTKRKKEKLVISKDKYVSSGKSELGFFCANNVNIKNNLKSSPGKMVFPNKIVTKNIDSDLLLRAIVFDADNTIYQTSKVAKLADMAAMEFFSGQTNKSPEYLYDFWKKKIVSKVSKETDPLKRHRKYSYGILANKFKIRNIERGFESFEKTLIDSLSLSKGFKEILPVISEYKLALLTEDNRDILDRKLKKFKMENLFDFVLSSSELGVMKPSEEYFESILSRLDVSASECLFIGDSFEKDLEIPMKNGANAVLFNEDGKVGFDKERKIKVINNLNYLREIIDGL